MSGLKPQPGELNLATLTPARVALGRTGASLTTHDVLAFSEAHAQARDAVHATLSLPTLLDALHRRGLHPVAVRSQAQNRSVYLRRPDLGRTLASEASRHLAALPRTWQSPSLSLILADGLSALAIDRHAIPLLDALLPRMTSFALTPVVVAEQARVALGDAVGEALNASLTVMLIGERPGLSSPDSLGAYLTWNPKPGRTDAERNCISNIREQGLDYETAARQIAWLAHEATRLQLTGTGLKEASQQPQLLP